MAVSYTHLSVKKTILPEFWSAAKGKALEKKREYKELNLYLDSCLLYTSYQVGFNNPKYFSRYFKEEFGILPSAFQYKQGR